MEPAAGRRPGGTASTSSPARPPATPAPQATLDGREILYLLDVPTTLKSQRLTLRVMTGRRQPEGSWQAIAPISLTRDAVPRLPDPATAPSSPC